MDILKRSLISFCISAACGAVTNMVIELIVCAVTGAEEFTTFSPEYMAMFSSRSVAIETAILLYGVIGAAFAAMSFVFKYNKMGFIVQNLLYALLTSAVWVPIITLIWQLQRYPQAFAGTLMGFAVSYLIMSIVGYKITKSDVEQINSFLKQKNMQL